MSEKKLEATAYLQVKALDRRGSKLQALGVHIDVPEDAVLVPEIEGEVATND